MELSISRHAQGRYAERIMDRDSKTDVAVFIRDHEDKIRNDIAKMITYGRVLYEGPTSRDPKRCVAVSLSGSWVILWDSKEMNVITIYCIDPGVGDEVSKAFIDGAVRQIESAREAYEATVKSTDEQVATYTTLIERAQGELNIHRKLCRDLEAQITGCRQMITAINTDNDIAQNKVRECVEVLIGKQKF